MGAFVEQLLLSTLTILGCKQSDDSSATVSIQLGPMRKSSGGSAVQVMSVMEEWEDRRVA